MKKDNLYLITADWHLRPDAPVCRLDPSWEDTMRGMVSYITSYANKIGATLVIVGDIFHQSQQPAWVVNLFLSLIDEGVIFIGNHDFRYRNMSEVENSSVGHILKNPKYTCCVPEFDEGFFQFSEEIMLCHRLVYKPENAGLAKFKSGISADNLIELALEENPKTKWIFIGDNHHHFDYENENRITVINPGSPLVYSAGMIEEKCGFYVVNTVEDLVTFKIVPDSKELLTDAHLRAEEERTEHLQTIVKTLNNVKVETFDFFELCDKKAKAMDKDFQDLHEDIKHEATTIKTKIGKGS